MRSLLPFLLPSLAAAIIEPRYDGWTQKWADRFEGSAGATPSTSTWVFADASFTNENDEKQTYRTTSQRNVQLSGGNTLQIIPQRDGGDSSRPYSSARLETKGIFVAPKGKAMKIEASIRFGESTLAQKEGMWPAFWMLGDAMRNGVGWPECGELDIMETTFKASGAGTYGTGTVHCDTKDNGICHEYTGIGAQSQFSNTGDFHKWSIVIDRRASNWQDQTITWYRDDQQFHQIGGRTDNRVAGSSAQMNEKTWARLAHSPFYIILNVAVGGIHSGRTTSATLFGWENMMEVAYVAHYEST